MPVPIKNIPLAKGEYYEEIVKKDTVFIHHTAGGHRPDWGVANWNGDKNKMGKQLPVATSYLIGGISTADMNAEWDGVIVNCFPDNFWAHHLGLNTANNRALNAKSIAVEICNYGPLTLSRDGKFYNYVNKPVPKEMAVELNKPFQGYRFYHKYTDKQISSLKNLLVELMGKYEIKIKNGLPFLLKQNKGENAFLLNQDALNGVPGLWTHTNVRNDKSDCSPQENLIAMLKLL